MTALITYFAINLADCTPRREALERQAEAAGIALNFIPAVDGRTTKPDTAGHRLKTGTWDWHGHELSGPQLGCLLSHRDALNQFLEGRAHYAVILEDDAEFSSKLPTQLDELTRTTGWDLIKIENRHKKKRGFTVAQTSWNAELLAGTKSDIGTTGLFWTRKGAEKCLRSLRTLCLPYDVHLAHYQARHIRMLDLVPPIVTQSGDFSTIGDQPNTQPKATYRERSWRKAVGQSCWSLFRTAKAFSTTFSITAPKRNPAKK